MPPGVERRAHHITSHSAPHAGEFAGAESIWGAIRSLHAERIGHGVRAIQDPTLVRYLADHHIALEVCPTSNLRLGVYPSLEAHPLRVLYEAGVILTINTDIPGLIGRTMSQELFLLAEPLDLPLDVIDTVLLNAVKHSFLPQDRKLALLADFRAELERLRPVADAGESP